MWHHHQKGGQPRLKRHLLPMRYDWPCWTPTQYFNISEVNLQVNCMAFLLLENHSKNSIFNWVLTLNLNHYIFLNITKIPATSILNILFPVWISSCSIRTLPGDITTYSRSLILEFVWERSLVHHYTCFSIWGGQHIFYFAFSIFCFTLMFFKHSKYLNTAIKLYIKILHNK